MPNHINLIVRNVIETTDFLTRFFEFECVAQKGDGAIAILKSNTGFLVVLSRSKNGEETVYPADFHIGFLQDSDDKVIEIYQKLLVAGIPLTGEPHKIRGSLGFYFYAPGNFMVEVSHLTV